MTNRSTPGDTAGDTFVIRMPDGAEFGPLAIAEVRSLLNQNRLPPTALIRRHSSIRWRMVADVTRKANKPAEKKAESVIVAELVAPVAAPSVQVADPPLAAPPVAISAPTPSGIQRAVPVDVVHSAAQPTNDETEFTKGLRALIVSIVIFAVLGGMFFVVTATGVDPRNSVVRVLSKFLFPAFFGNLWLFIASMHRVIKSALGEAQ
jgi:hypothetical protein